MAERTFDHCVIHVSDWDRSTAFYRDVLGAEVVPHGRGVMFRFGTVHLNTHGAAWYSGGAWPSGANRCTR